MEQAAQPVDKGKEVDERAEGESVGEGEGEAEEGVDHVSHKPERGLGDVQSISDPGLRSLLTVNSFLSEPVVLPSTWSFGSFLSDDSEL